MPEPQFDSHRQIATPQSKPQVGGDYTYFKDDDGFYGMKSDGTEFLIGPGSGGGGTDFVPVGTTGYTVTTGRSGERVYTSTDGDAVVFASKLDGDAHVRQYLFADPEAGIYWSDGTVDASTGSGVNLFLWDNRTMALDGQLRIANGILKMIGQNVEWSASDPSAGIGDYQTNHTVPSWIGVRGYTTTDRNALAITATTDHYMVFDTTLGKPIWSDGAGGWVDATGASV